MLRRERVSLILCLLLLPVGLVSSWRIFQKAGLPGWKAVVPFYNGILMFRIADLPAWQAVVAMASGAIMQLVNFALRQLPTSLLQMAISMVTGGLIFGLYLVFSYSLAGKFGKSTGFAIGLILLPFIFYPILAFGDAEYDDSASVGPTVLRLS